MISIYRELMTFLPTDDWSTASELHTIIYAPHGANVFIRKVD